MRKQHFGNLALALVLTVWVVLTPAPVMATPSGIVQFDTFGMPSGSIGDVVYDGVGASGTGLGLSGITFLTGGNTYYFDYTDPGTVIPYTFSFNTALASLTVDYHGELRSAIGPYTPGNDLEWHVLQLLNPGQYRAYHHRHGIGHEGPIVSGSPLWG